MDVEHHMEMYSKTAPTWSNGQPGATGPPPLPTSPFVPSSAQDTLHYLNDCRHYEPDIPTPGQGQRLHSFAATPYQPFGPSPEPVVKRDQSTAELAQMQYYGPRSRDITHSHINSYPAVDPNRQNLRYNTPSLPPMTTQPSLPALAYPPRYEYPSEPSTTKRKRARTSQACTACRATKAKCDDPKPCSLCKAKEIECVWKPEEPKYDRVQAQFGQRLDIILEMCTSTQKEMKEMKKLRGEQDVKIQHLNDQVQRLHERLHERRGADTFDYTDSESPYTSSSQGEEEECWKALLPGEPAIPVGHTTGAARLLLWPAVRNIMGEMLKTGEIKTMECFVEYPNIEENNHGLRLYGRRPGSGRAHSSSSSLCGGLPDESSLGPESIYGQIGGVSPRPNFNGYINQRPEERRDGTGPDGQLELDEVTVKRLLESYLKHIHIMQPILDPTKLRADAEKFTNQFQPNFVRKPKIPATTMDPPEFVYGIRETPGQNGKRSLVGTMELPDVTPLHPLKPKRPWRPIKNAVLLLVLALGKICDHREKLSDVLPGQESTSSGSLHLQSRHLSSILQSPVVTSQSSDRTSPQGSNHNALRRQLTENYVPSRNLDVIPGLAYAEFATNILGSEMGKKTLHHVHAFILASLYYSQLARPSSSHRFLNSASVALQVILRNKLNRLSKYRINNDVVPVKDNPLIFAFWTCLQLESDIVAELDLPHSGITMWEKYMPWPNLEAAKAAGRINAVQTESYQAQLYLRNHLNRIHSELYGVKPTGESLEEGYKLPIANAQNDFPIIKAMVDSIPKMINIAPSMAWSETDPPANDVLTARLRAKYYGAEVITYRPFLKMVMNRPSRSDKGFNSGSHDIALLLEEISPKIMGYAKLCIRAMENSTKAFYGIEGGRLIVTNVWGTAHAQWGNVILLLTAYQDPMLRPHIDRENLKILVEKTLGFLHDVADPASALITDIRILKFTAQKTGFLKEQGPTQQAR